MRINGDETQHKGRYAMVALCDIALQRGMNCDPVGYFPPSGYFTGLSGTAFREIAPQWFAESVRGPGADINLNLPVSRG